MPNTTNSNSILAWRSVYQETNIQTKVTGLIRDASINFLVCGILTEEGTN